MEQISTETWKMIDEAGLQRARMVNAFVKAGYTPSMDMKVSDLHTKLAEKLLKTAIELGEFTLATVKELIEQCSEEYIFDKSLFS